MSFSDEELSDQVEGVAPAELAARIERASTEDAALRARLEALRALLPRRVDLASIEVPAGLLESTLGTLERAGLVEPLVPAGLLEKTLARVEEAGLMAPAPPAVSILPRPRTAITFLRAAAVALFTLGVGLASGYSLRGDRVVTVAKVERVEVPVEKIVIKEVENRVEVPVPFEKKVEVPVIKEVVKEVVRIERVEVPVEVVKEVRVTETAKLDVTASSGVERWQSAEQRWVVVAAGSSLEAGTLVRGQGQASLTAGTKRTRLSSGLYVLSERRTFDPVPEGELARAPATSRPGSPAVRPSPESVPELLALRASGLPEEQARAQRELEGRYETLGDPGPSVLSSVTAFVSGSQKAPKGPPASAEGWRAWWSRVESTRK